MSNLITTFGHAYSQGVRDAAKKKKRTMCPYEKKIFVDGWMSGYHDFHKGKVKLLKSGEWELVNA